MADDRPLVAVTFRLGRDQLAELFGDEVRAEAVVELPEEEWRKPVPSLRADEEVLVGTTGEPVRVLDALFFEGW